MIILEGPDGGGKTTLLHQIQERTGIVQAPRFATSEGGPKDDMARLVIDDIVNWPKLQIYDRHGIISDAIYGPIHRGQPSPGLDQWDSYATLYKMMMEHDPLIIWCLPPLAVAKYNESQGPRLDGVGARFTQIWWAYHFMSAQDQHREGRSFLWDYTEEFSTSRLELIISQCQRIAHPSLGLEPRPNQDLLR